MIIIVHSPHGGGAGEKSVVDDNLEQYEMEKARLVSALTNAELPVPDESPFKVTSIFFQEFNGLSHPGPEHPVQVSLAFEHVVTILLYNCVLKKVVSY
jgi:tRNA (uracil-5-)-methyltransferase